MMEQELAALNKQAIAVAKKHMGQVAWGTVALSAVVLSAYVASFWLTATAVMPLWLGFLMIAALGYMSYTPVHEAAHGNINGDRTDLKWLNDLCGYLCAQLVMIPYSTHKVEHFTHHRFTNQADKDPDFIISGMGNGIWNAIKSITLFLWTQITFLFRDHWARAPLNEKLIYCAEVGIAVSWRIVLLALLPAAIGITLVIGAYLVAVVFTSYWFAYRPHHPYQESARYRNTNSLIMPRWMKPLEWFWLGQNLHSIHHAFPRVPFYRYHAVFREIEPILRAHGAPVIGIFDREPIEHAH